MAAVTISGVLTMVEAKRMTDPDYLGIRKYSPNTERYLHYLNCCLTTADGKRFFFSSPKVSQTVANCPGASVVCYHIKGTASQWFAEKAGNGVCTAERTNTNGLCALVKVGDTVTIRASVKAEKPNYTALNRVKMISR